MQQRDALVMGHERPQDRDRLGRAPDRHQRQGLAVALVQLWLMVATVERTVLVNEFLARRRQDAQPLLDE